MFRKYGFPVLAALTICAASLKADEPTRQVQEELRKRNLFYGDIDGRQSPALAAALKQYQERKGFAITGEIDPDTLRSLSISASNAGDDLPNVPVLQSDRGLAEGSNPGRDLSFVSGLAPMNQTPPSRSEISAFIRSYLDASQTPSVNDDLTFYGGRIAYFRHGDVTKTYIRNELVAYGQQWPEREYVLGDTINIRKRGAETLASCRISFKVANPEQNRQASGVTENTFVLARRPDLRWEIVGQREERVRPARSGSRSRNKSPLMRRVQRSMRKFFR